MLLAQSSKYVNIVCVFVCFKKLPYSHIAASNEEEEFYHFNAFSSFQIHKAFFFFSFYILTRNWAHRKILFISYCPREANNFSQAHEKKEKKKKQDEK